jgi:hypothetical protein
MKRDPKDKSYNQVMNEWAAQQDFLKRSRSSIFLPGGGAHGMDAVRGWLLRILGFLVLPLAAYTLLLRSHLGGESFNKEMEEQVGAWLASPQVETSGASIDLSGELRIKEVAGPGGPSAPFSEIKAEKLTASLGPAGFFRQKWKFPSLSAFSLTAQLRSGGASKPAGPPKSASVGDGAALMTAGFGVSPDYRYLSFDRFSTGSLNLNWGTNPATAGHLTGAVAFAQRTAQGWDITARSGMFGLGWLDGLKIANASLQMADGRAILQKAELTPPSGGSGTLEGSISFGEIPDIAATATLTEIRIDDFLPKPFADFGEAVCTGTVTFKGSTNRSEGIMTTAELTPLSGALHALPIFRALELATGGLPLLQPRITGGQIRFRSGGTGENNGYFLDTKGTELICGPALKVIINARHERALAPANLDDPTADRPVLTVNSGSVLIGLSTSTAASLTPKVRETFFAREADGMVWTEIPISGNGSDLTRKAAEAITAAHNAEDP